MSVHEKDTYTTVVAQIVHDYIGVHETPYIEFTARDTSEHRAPVLVGHGVSLGHLGIRVWIGIDAVRGKAEAPP